jgi:zinc protease
VVKEDHSVGVVAVSVVVRAGSRSETEAENGISHLMEHMLFKGTASRGVGEIDREIEGMGGIINAGTTQDFTNYWIVSATADYPQALRILADAVMHPLFPASELEKEKRIIFEEIRGAEVGPQGTLSRLVAEAAYPTHPYGRPIPGTPESLSGITREMLLAYHRKWYHPGNTSVVIVGDVDPAAAGRMVEAAFAGFPAAAAPNPHYAVPPLRLRMTELRESRPVRRTYFTMAFAAPPITKPEDVAAMDVLVTLLGDGFSSRQGRLVDMISADFLTQRDPGLLHIWAVCAPDQVAAARASILSEVDRLRTEPVAAAELAKAKRVLEVAYAFSNETYADQADTLGFYEGIATAQFALDYVAAIRRVSAADLTAVASRYLDPRRYVWAVVEPEAGTAPSASPGDQP